MTFISNFNFCGLAKTHPPAKFPLVNVANSLCEMTPVELSSLFERWEDERISITKDVIPLQRDDTPMASSQKATNND